MQPTTVTLEGQEFPIHIKRHGRAKRYTLRYDSEQELIKLTVPKRASIKAGLEFTESRANWLFQQMHKTSNKLALEPGVTFPLLGFPTLLVHQAGRGVATLYSPPAKSPDFAMGPSSGLARPTCCALVPCKGIAGGVSRPSEPSAATRRDRKVQGASHARGVAERGDKKNILTIHGEIDFFRSRLRRYLKQYLHETIEPLAQQYAEQLGVRFRKVSIRDTRSHWGSCTPDGQLSFAFRLVFAEPEIVDYIVAHEVAHLRELNHSKAFWQLTEQLCPDYKTHRQWLKKHGDELGRYVI